MNVQKVFLQAEFLRKVMIAHFATELGFNIALMHHMSVQKFLYRVRTLTLATFERSSALYTNQNITKVYYSITTVTVWVIRINVPFPSGQRLAFDVVGFPVAFTFSSDDGSALSTSSSFSKKRYKRNYLEI